MSKYYVIFSAVAFLPSNVSRTYKPVLCQQSVNNHSSDPAWHHDFPLFNHFFPPILDCDLLLIGLIFALSTLTSVCFLFQGNQASYAVSSWDDL